MQETTERARREFFPKLQAAPGFVGFYLVNDQENGINTAIVVWEDEAHAEAFQEEAQSWARVLDEMGNVVESNNRGETVVSLEAQR
jgi:heme-degrading monooxygenase HmoA